MATSNAELIPRKTFFANPDKAGPSISRDGLQIGYIAPVDGVMNIWVAQVGEAFNGSSVRILNGGDEIPGLDGVVVDSE